MEILIDTIFLSDSLPCLALLCFETLPPQGLPGPAISAS